jgi:plasmid maintenance system antidote protein VapI
MKTKKQKLPPITPGEIFLKEFLQPMQLTQHRFARQINVPYGVIHEIFRVLEGKR